MTIKVVNVCGARPNLMKIAPLYRAYPSQPSLEPILVHTGQHYDDSMSQWFFDELEIPRPNVNLDVGSGSHARQTAAVMERFEDVLLSHKPHAVVVVGDVNSTIACALVACKMGVTVVHVEAGLRSFDRSMPEEINRLLTDAVSDLLFVTEPSGLNNLRAEGVAEEKIHFVGNVMIDSLLFNLPKAAKSDVLERLGVASSQYALLTLHRPANVDDGAVFGGILDALEVIVEDLPIVFPVHPRTRDNLDRLGLMGRGKSLAGLKLTDPLGYLDFLKLTSNAAVVLTDSGGLQEEATILQVPCLTLRGGTERPVTVERGRNLVVGVETERIVAGYRELRIMSSEWPAPPDLWDGHAADRIVEILARELPKIIMH